MNAQSEMVFPVGVDLEYAINQAALTMATSTSKDVQRAAWNMLQAFQKSRSKERIAQMEREQGLAR